MKTKKKIGSLWRKAKSDLGIASSSKKNTSPPPVTATITITPTVAAESCALEDIQAVNDELLLKHKLPKKSDSQVVQHKIFQDNQAEEATAKVNTTVKEISVEQQSESKRPKKAKKPKTRSTCHLKSLNSKSNRKSPKIQKSALQQFREEEALRLPEHNKVDIDKVVDEGNTTNKGVCVWDGLCRLTVDPEDEILTPKRSNATPVAAKSRSRTRMDFTRKDEMSGGDSKKHNTAPKMSPRSKTRMKRHNLATNSLTENDDTFPNAAVYNTPKYACFGSEAIIPDATSEESEMADRTWLASNYSRNHHQEHASMDIDRVIDDVNLEASKAFYCSMYKCLNRGDSSQILKNDSIFDGLESVADAAVSSSRIKGRSGLALLSGILCGSEEVSLETGRELRIRNIASACSADDEVVEVDTLGTLGTLDDGSDADIFEHGTCLSDEEFGEDEEMRVDTYTPKLYGDLKSCSGTETEGSDLDDIILDDDEDVGSEDYDSVSATTSSSSASEEESEDESVQDPIPQRLHPTPVCVDSPVSVNRNSTFESSRASVVSGIQSPSSIKILTSLFKKSTKTSQDGEILEKKSSEEEKDVIAKKDNVPYQVLCEVPIQSPMDIGVEMDLHTVELMMKAQKEEDELIKTIEEEVIQTLTDEFGEFGKHEPKENTDRPSASSLPIQSSCEQDTKDNDNTEHTAEDVIGSGYKSSPPLSTEFDAKEPENCGDKTASTLDVGRQNVNEEIALEADCIEVSFEDSLHDMSLSLDAEQKPDEFDETPICHMREEPEEISQPTLSTTRDVQEESKEASQSEEKIESNHQSNADFAATEEELKLGSESAKEDRNLVVDKDQSEKEIESGDQITRELSAIEEEVESRSESIETDGNLVAIEEIEAGPENIKINGLLEDIISSSRSEEIDHSAQMCSQAIDTPIADEHKEGIPNKQESIPSTPPAEAKIEDGSDDCVECDNDNESRQDTSSLRHVEDRYSSVIEAIDDSPRQDLNIGQHDDEPEKNLIPSTVSPKLPPRNSVASSGHLTPQTEALSSTSEGAEIKNPTEMKNLMKPTGHRRRNSRIGKMGSYFLRRSQSNQGKRDRYTTVNE